MTEHINTERDLQVISTSEVKEGNPETYQEVADTETLTIGDVRFRILPHQLYVHTNSGFVQIDSLRTTGGIALLTGEDSGILIEAAVHLVPPDDLKNVLQPLVAMMARTPFTVVINHTISEFAAPALRKLYELYNAEPPINVPIVLTRLSLDYASSYDIQMRIQFNIYNHLVYTPRIDYFSDTTHAEEWAAALDTNRNNHIIPEPKANTEETLLFRDTARAHSLSIPAPSNNPPITPIPGRSTPLTSYYGGLLPGGNEDTERFLPSPNELELSPYQVDPSDPPLGFKYPVISGTWKSWNHALVRIAEAEAALRKLQLGSAHLLSLESVRVSDRLLSFTNFLRVFSEELAEIAESASAIGEWDSISSYVGGVLEGLNNAMAPEGKGPPPAEEFLILRDGRPFNLGKLPELIARLDKLAVDISGETYSKEVKDAVAVVMNGVFSSGGDSIISKIVDKVYDLVRAHMEAIETLHPSKESVAFSHTVTTAIGLELTNKMAEIPVQGSPFPTYQFLGSGAWRASVRAVTTDPADVTRVNEVNHSVQATAALARATMAPPDIFADYRLEMEPANGFLRSLGFKYAIMDNLQINNIAGAPDSWSMNFTLVQAPNRLRDLEVATRMDNTRLYQISTCIARRLVSYVWNPRGVGDYPPEESWVKETYPPDSRLLRDAPQFRDVPHTHIIQYVPEPTRMMSWLVRESQARRAWTRLVTELVSYTDDAMLEVAGKAPGTGSPKQMRSNIRNARDSILHQCSECAYTVKGKVSACGEGSLIRDTYKNIIQRRLIIRMREILSVLSEKEILTLVSSIDSNLNVEPPLLRAVGLILDIQLKDEHISCYPDMGLGPYTVGDLTSYLPPDFYMYSEQPDTDQNIDTVLERYRKDYDSLQESLFMADVLKCKDKLDALDVGDATKEAFTDVINNYLDKRKNHAPRRLELQDLVLKHLLIESYTLSYMVYEAQGITDTDQILDVLGTGASSEDIRARIKEMTKKLVDRIKKAPESEGGAALAFMRARIDHIRATSNLSVEAMTEEFGLNSDKDRNVRYKRMQRMLQYASVQDRQSRMLYAFPTFRFYIIDEDQPTWYLLDDTYLYQAVTSIEIIQSRKAATDTLVIKLTNVGGWLTDSAAADQDAITDDSTGEHTDDGVSWSRNKLASMNLQTGTKIRVRLGYGATPNQLPLKFQGRITAIDPGPVTTLTCTSDGAELTQVISEWKSSWLGLGDTRTSGDVATGILDQVPGLRSFGKPLLFSSFNERLRSKGVDPSVNRWLSNQFLNTARIVARHIAPSTTKGLSGMWISQYDPAALIYLGTPRDDNIMLSSIDNLWGVADVILPDIIWAVENQSAWDALWELALYQPNYIVDIKNYNDNNADTFPDTRSTIYVGPKDGFYKYTDQLHEEAEAYTADFVTAPDSPFYLEVGKITQSLMQLFGYPGSGMTPPSNLVSLVTPQSLPSPSPTARHKLLVSRRSGGDYSNALKVVEDYGSIIEAEAYSNVLNPVLVAAVIHHESQGGTILTGGDGEVGLMHIMPETAAEKIWPLFTGNRTDRGNATALQSLLLMSQLHNIRYGCKYLRHLLDTFGNCTVLALAAYNGSPEDVWEVAEQEGRKGDLNYLKSKYGRDWSKAESTLLHIKSSTNAAINAAYPQNVLDCTVNYDSEPVEISTPTTTLEQAFQETQHEAVPTLEARVKPGEIPNYFLKGIKLSLQNIKMKRTACRIRKVADTTGPSTGLSRAKKGYEVTKGTYEKVYNDVFADLKDLLSDQYPAPGINIPAQGLFRNLLDTYYARHPQYKPVQKHHVLSGTTGILHNSIRTTLDGFHNVVNVTYPGEGWYKGKSAQNPKTLQLHTATYDDDIPAEYQRTYNYFAKNYSSSMYRVHNAMRAVINTGKEKGPNSWTEDTSKMDAVGIEFDKIYDTLALAPAYITVGNNVLCMQMSNMYDGWIETIGKPEVDPWDVVHLFDDYSQMYGSFEVDTVVHRFTPDTGFTTSIRPALLTFNANHEGFVEAEYIKTLKMMSTAAATGGVLKSIGKEALEVGGLYTAGHLLGKLLRLGPLTGPGARSGITTWGFTADPSYKKTPPLASAIKKLTKRGIPVAKIFRGTMFLYLGYVAVKAGVAGTLSYINTFVDHGAHLLGREAVVCAPLIHRHRPLTTGIHGAFRDQMLVHTLDDLEEGVRDWLVKTLPNPGAAQ